MSPTSSESYPETYTASSTTSAKSPGADDPTANGYDRIRALKILYDRGLGKVTRNQARTRVPESERPPKSEKSQNHTNHSSDNKRQVVQLEQKLDDALGPPQAPAEPEAPPQPQEAHKSHGLPAPSPDTPNYTPDLVRDSQYYVLEITNYGDELASILWDIHQPDPEDDSIRSCHRITAGQMIIDRVIGPVPDDEIPLDHWHDPSLEPNWAYKHPAEIDSSVPLEEMIEADRDARQFLEDYRQQADSPCEDCTDEYLCEFHDPKSELYEAPRRRRRPHRDRPRHEKPQDLRRPPLLRRARASSASTPHPPSTTPNHIEGEGEPALSLSKGHSGGGRNPEEPARTPIRR